MTTEQVSILKKELDTLYSFARKALVNGDDGDTRDTSYRRLALLLNSINITEPEEAEINAIT
jgi:hypothetical protein